MTCWHTKGNRRKGWIQTHAPGLDCPRGTRGVLDGGGSVGPCSVRYNPVIGMTLVNLERDPSRLSAKRLAATALAHQATRLRCRGGPPGAILICAK